MTRYLIKLVDNPDLCLLEGNYIESCEHEDRLVFSKLTFAYKYMEEHHIPGDIFFAAEHICNNNNQGDI